jgi:hypothetical protein
VVLIPISTHPNIEVPGQDWTARLTLKCFPRGVESSLHVAVAATIQFSDARPGLMARLTIGQLDKDGNERDWGTFLTMHGCENRFDMFRGEVGGPSDSWLPNGRLILFVRASFYVWWDRLVRNNAGRRCRRPLGGGETTPKGAGDEQSADGRDLHKIMLKDNNLVDLGPASVLLVFEDGEQHCHTFPLAARYGHQFLTHEVLKGHMRPRKSKKVPIFIILLKTVNIDING